MDNNNLGQQINQPPEQMNRENGKWQRFFLSAYIAGFVTILLPTLVYALMKTVFEESVNSMGMAAIVVILPVLFVEFIGVICSAVFAAGSLIYLSRYGKRGKFYYHAVIFSVVVLIYWVLLFRGYL